MAATTLTPWRPWVERIAPSLVLKILSWIIFARQFRENPYLQILDLGDPKSHFQLGEHDNMTYINDRTESLDEPTRPLVDEATQSIVQVTTVPDWELVEVANGTRFPLFRGKASIGKALDNTITITDPTVSRHHLSLDVGRDTVQVQDLDSVNGTFINGEKVNSAFIQTGDVMKVATHEFMIVPANAPKYSEATHDITSLHPNYNDSVTGDPYLSPALACIGTVVIARGKDAGAAFPLGPDGALVGTADKCQIRISDTSTSSRIHARIRVANNDRLLVSDLGSESGSKIAGRLLRPGEEMEWSPNHTLNVGKSISLRWFPVGAIR